MMLAWRAYRFTEHVSQMQRSRKTVPNSSRIENCLSTFSYKKLFIHHLSDNEKDDVARYALKKGYIVNPFEPHYSPFVSVSDDLGLRLITDKFAGIPYAALYEAYNPYSGLGLGAFTTLIVVTIWHFFRAHIHL